MKSNLLTLKDLNKIATLVNKRLKHRCENLGLKEVPFITPVMVRFVVEEVARRQPDAEAKTLVIDRNLPKAELDKQIREWWG